MGKVIGSSTTLDLPLVSVSIINWNYGKYLERTIESLKRQTYDKFEAYVIDNGSSDDSLDIINKAVDSDKRFTVIKLNENLGQLGAYFEVHKMFKGDLVVNLDADDMLFPDFIETHVSVHAVLDVGLSSSDVSVIDQDDQVVMHGYHARSRHQPDSIEKLGDLNVSIHSGPVDWIWGPGTSNMYKKSVLDKIYFKRPSHVWMRSCDNFLNPLCHAIAGSAIVDKELSAYRVHDNNSYGNMRTVKGGHKDKQSQAKQRQDFYETIDILFSKSKGYSETLGDKYWEVIKDVSRFIASPGGTIMPGSSETIALIEKNYKILCSVFTKSVVLEQLPSVFVAGDIGVALRHLGEQYIPPRRQFGPK